MKKIILMIMLVFVLLVGRTFSNTFDHSVYDTFLQRFVSNGLVDYKGMAKQQATLNKYLQSIEHVDPIKFENWSENEQMTFWINAYNAITLEAILRNYPIQWGSFISWALFPKSSIRQINKVWDTFYTKVMGKELTLNQIEHEILRKKFHDPRIHFAIVCASIGCPKLESRAFLADDLEQRLEGAARNFISDSKQVKLNKKENTIYLSSIFEWYKGDFEASPEVHRNFKNYSKSERGIIEFIVNRLSQEDQQFVFNNQPKIKYLKYDWTLNEQK